LTTNRASPVSGVADLAYFPLLCSVYGASLVSSSGEAAGFGYHRALAVARSQSTKTLELRAATSLARLWRDEGKRTEARDLLDPIYGWFTEAFDTPVLQDPKALLNELAS
jgi:hypothetical protein